MTLASLAPPPFLAIHHVDGLPPQLAVSPASEPVHNFGKQPPEHPMCTGDAPPVARAPPMLCRQNASRFSWPPDPDQEWTYLCLSPAEVVEQAQRQVGVVLTQRGVAEYFSSRQSESAAYAAYATRWRGAIDDLLQAG